MSIRDMSLLSFFLTAPPTTEIYTLSLHDALPISQEVAPTIHSCPPAMTGTTSTGQLARATTPRRVEPNSTSRSEEHTSQLQSQSNLVCRLLLEKKKKEKKTLKR